MWLSSLWGRFLLELHAEAKQSKRDFREKSREQEILTTERQEIESILKYGR